MRVFNQNEKSEEINERVYDYFKRFYGEDAEFREGQLEAILSALNGDRSLIVQRTGWGKSLIYFLSTKILRDSGAGITLIISPLLALMNNQLEFAERFNLRAVTINSNNVDEWSQVKRRISGNDVDILFISPERLANESFNNDVLKNINIGMLVIDEAHCISDWGHDFRPDYRRIIQVIKYLPNNVPLLATTATANDRVVEDVAKQLGKNIKIHRGGLVRESLSIHVIHLDSREERLVWLSENIPKINGVGIVYCLTKRDCDLVNKWLRINHIDSYAYYSGITGESLNSSEERRRIEKMFINNEMKVLVATTAFGMGIDKSDIGFVIHFQKPGSVVSYYQQIGRAGRAINNAYAVLLAGSEDDKINEYFIHSAFPSPSEMDEVVKVIEQNDSVSMETIMEFTNQSKGRLEKSLKFLQINGVIFKEKSRYYRSPVVWKPDVNYSKKITKIRENELKRMNDFISTDACLMKFIVNELNDYGAVNCGKCSNCMGHFLFKSVLNQEKIELANSMIKENLYFFGPRKKWNNSKKIDKAYQYENGIALSSYGDSGWGKIVSEDKYKNNSFRDELVKESVKCIRANTEYNCIKWVTAVPSLRRPGLVSDFAKKLAVELGIPYFDSMTKKEAVEQIFMNNSIQQRDNAWNSFKLKYVHDGAVLLVDDMVDSRWTFTVCAYKLIKHGSGKVFPFALSNSSKSGG